MYPKKVTKACKVCIVLICINAHCQLPDVSGRLGHNQSFILSNPLTYTVKLSYIVIFLSGENNICYSE